METERRHAEPVSEGALVPQQVSPPTMGAARRADAGWRVRMRRTPGGALLLKALVFALGLAFVALGCVLVVAPGPLTIPPILLGLWIWSTEFAWAERQLDRARVSARVAWDDAKRRPIVSAAVTGGGLVALGAVIWLAAEYDLVARLREVVGV